MIWLKYLPAIGAVLVAAAVAGYTGYRAGWFFGHKAGWEAGHKAGEAAEAQKWLAAESEALRQTKELLAEAVVRYTAQVDRATQLQRTLAVTQAQVRKLTREKEDAIRQYVRGNECLSADAVRVLNAEGRVSADAAASASGSAGGVAPGTAASDRDVASWIIDARERYANCAAQVNAWVAWYGAKKEGRLPGPKVAATEN